MILGITEFVKFKPRNFPKKLDIVSLKDYSVYRVQEKLFDRW